MANNPYKEWTNLYNKDLEFIWYSQNTPLPLRNASMLLKAIQNEFEKINKNMEVQYRIYEEKIKNMEERKETVTLNEEKENNTYFEDCINITSPEVFDFTNLSVLNDTTNVENEANTIYNNTSPKINRLNGMPRLKLLKKRNISNYSALKFLQSTPTCSKNIQLHDDVVDSTIIQSTPEIKHIQQITKHCKVSDRLKKSKRKYSINCDDITDSTNKEDSATDATYCPFEHIAQCSPFSMGTNDFMGSPKKESKELGTTNPNIQEREINNPPAEFNVKKDTNKMKKTKIEVNKPNFVYKEETVRGKERLKLEGWECADCEKFYSAFGLTAGETKKLLNKCSRHRSKFKPHDYTPKGFWDMDFPPTQD